MDLGIAIVFVQLVQALAWPAAVIVILLVLRRPIIAAIERLDRVEHGGIRVSFGEGVRAVQDALPAAPTRELDQDERTRLVDLAASQPKLAVLEAWETLEGRLHDLARGKNVDLEESQQGGPIALAERLQQKGLISSATQQAVVEMRLLRNKVKHWSAMRVRAEDAVAYIDSALKLAAEAAAETQRRAPAALAR